MLTNSYKLHVFWDFDFGGILDAKIHDFNSFFGICSMQNCNGFGIRKNDAQNGSLEGGEGD